MMNDVKGYAFATLDDDEGVSLNSEARQENGKTSSGLQKQSF